MFVVDTNISILSALPRYFTEKSEHFSDQHKNMRASKLVEMISNFFFVDKIYYFGYLAYPFGFPDIIDIGKYIPYPLTITKILTGLDSVISNVPVIRIQSWGVMIRVQRKKRLKYYD